MEAAATTKPPRTRGGVGAGRPTNSEQRVEQRRNEIIEAAYEVFSERGYTAAGIADIAQKLGIGHGTFYRYFKNKRDILDHVVDYGVNRMTDYILDDATRPAETFEELRKQLRSIGERLFAAIDREPGILQVVLLEATSIDEEMTQRILGMVDSFGALCASMLNNGVRRGFLRADLDTAVVGRALTALTLPGLLAESRGSFSPQERTRSIEATVDLVCNGIRRPAG